jgi:hypothetical protein
MEVHGMIIQKIANISFAEVDVGDVLPLIVVLVAG